MTQITEQFLKDKNACSDGVKWVTDNGLIGRDAVPFIRALMGGDKLDWANWLIVRVMERKQYLAYAIYAAEQVLGIYEKKYPGKDAPRKAIEAARRVLENDTEENRKSAYAAADAAYAAAAYAAADAAYAAAAAAYAAYAAADAAYDARKKMKIKILEYGLTLLTP